MRGWEIALVVILVPIAILLLYLIIAAIVGLVNQERPVCPRGYRALSVDGSKSITPNIRNDIVVPTLDFPVCAPMNSCPPEGEKFAVLKDGSSLQNVCDEPNCRCSIFQHCPAYVSTVFRQYGADDRISYFQVVDPTLRDTKPPNDPFNPPIIIEPGSRDSCFITEAMREVVWKPLHVGDSCLRGTLAKLSTNLALLACVPTSYVDSSGVFDVSRYLSNYNSPPRSAV